MFSFTVIKVYDEYDKDFGGDFLEMRLIDNLEGKVVMSGDYYHNKIEEKIEGFFKCLDHFGIMYKVTHKEINEGE